MDTTKQKKHFIAPFLKGFASAFDITGGTFTSKTDFSTGWEKDGAAIRGDWQRVGDDIRSAMNQIKYEQ
jgi:hypothetical protein